MLMVEGQGTRQQLCALSSLELTLLIEASRKPHAGKYAMNYAWASAMELVRRDQEPQT
jgi:hypothetical protein